MFEVVLFAWTQALSLGRHCSIALSMTLCFNSAHTTMRRSFNSSILLSDRRVPVLDSKFCGQLDWGLMSLLARVPVQWSLVFHVAATQWCPLLDGLGRCPAGRWRSRLTPPRSLATSSPSTGHSCNIRRWPSPQVPRRTIPCTWASKLISI